MGLAIEVSNVSKVFRRYRPDRPHTLQEVLARGFKGIRSRERFWGLRDVSFTVPRGRTVGIIGTNGSGKSTLLRLVGGIGRPDTGRVKVSGRIGALLDLGSGFHTDLTGRENAIVGGVLNGLTRREVLRRLDEIVAFAEVEKFIDNPMRTYSTGMQMRLAFSTAVHTNPEVLLIDEVLSVGDTAFQRKCLDRIAQFKANGCSILLVSHSSSMVQNLCDEALWLNGGLLMAHDSAHEVVRQYVEHVSPGLQPLPPSEAEIAIQTVLKARPKIRNERGGELIVDENRFGSVELTIVSVGLFHVDGQPLEEIRSGQPLRIGIDFLAADTLVAPLFRVRVIRDDGLVCYDLSTEQSELSLSAIAGSGRVTLVLDRVDLNTGRYTFDVGAYAHDWAYAYDHQASVCSLLVIGDNIQEAVLNVPHRWELQAATVS
jgi:lipopolysaccharide transport system ATP-binding protein